MNITRIIKQTLILLTLCGLLICSTVYGAEQVVYPYPENVIAFSGSEVSFDVYYNTTDQNPYLTGLGFRMHWDSDVLEFQNVSQVYAQNLFVLGESERDVDNYDRDERTDLFANYSWLDIEGDWPLNLLPIKLLRATFKVLDHDTHSTQVNFSSSANPASYSLVQVPFEIDISNIIEAGIKLDPETLNLSSRIEWITAYIELPAWYDINNIETVAVALMYNENHLFADWGEPDEDGRLMFKFDGETVLKWFKDLHGQEIELTVLVKANGDLFQGTDTIRIINVRTTR